MKVGLQLYGVREALKEDFVGTLRAVKEMGYDSVEFAGGRYGRTGSETAKILEDLGLTCLSVHTSPSLYLEDAADVFSYVKALGASFGVIPIAPGRLEAFTLREEETLALFGKMAEDYLAEGITLLYHNHDFEFNQVEGERIYDRIFRKLPHLLPEPDLCWASYGGMEPAALLKAYAGKVPVVHFKDYRCEALGDAPVWRLLKEGTISRPEKRSACGFRYLPLGEGVEDWAAALSAAQAAGTKAVIVEQDESRDRPSLEAARASRIFLKEQLGI